MKIGIVGSRGFHNYTAFKQLIQGMVTNKDMIVSGGCPKGADHLAELYAKEMKIDIKIFTPAWNKYGKSAGMIRNGQIVEESDYVIAFWDGKSIGTKDTIDKCANTGKYCMVVDVAGIYHEENFHSDDNNYSEKSDFEDLDHEDAI